MNADGVEGKFEAANTTPEFLPKERRVIAVRAKHGEWCERRYRDLSDAVYRLAERTRVDATSLPIDDVVWTMMSEGVRVSVRLLVPNRDVVDRLEWIQIWRDYQVPWQVLEAQGMSGVIRATRDIAHGTLGHEFDESLTIDGVRVLDPHRELVP